MKNIEAMSLRVKDNQIELLDQQMLPQREVWIETPQPKDMIAAIKSLKVRGAPLIGVAAALSLAKLAEEGANESDFLAAAEALRASRPTAVNLMNAIDRLCCFENSYDSAEVVAKAEALFAEDVELCERIATNGSALIDDGDGVLTHCNTGGLATVGWGTALGVIRKAHLDGKKIHVFVDETRPLLQGGRLTTWELEKLNIPYTLICDNMAATLMAQGRIHKVIVGADRIALNGDFANKIGTYSVATLSYYHRVPFYVAAPYTTVDQECPTGVEIPIEQRSANEVRGVAGYFGEVQWAPKQAEVYNPAFDVTPSEFVSGWILDDKVYNLEEIHKQALKK